MGKVLSFASREKAKQHTGTLQCTECEEEKPCRSFNLTNAPNGRIYFRRVCRQCQGDFSVDTGKPSVYALGKRRERDARRCMAAYGITREEYDQLWINAEGRCDICWAELIDSRAAHIDHCHKTHRVRGILCKTCNIRMAVVDNIRWLKKALAYRRRHRSAA